MRSPVALDRPLHDDYAEMISVNTAQTKAGGFGLRLKAGPIRHSAD
jgi:hypothetical protein